MKKGIVFGFMVGALIFGTAGVLAGQYVATENVFPIQLNGENVHLEGYNIDGSTYFKLRDIADIVGGFSVGFNNDIIQLSKDGYVYDDISDADSLLKSFARQMTSVTDEETGKVYKNLRFLIADLTDDGKNDLLAVGIDEYDNMGPFEVYENTGGNVIKLPYTMRVNGTIYGPFGTDFYYHNGGCFVIGNYAGKVSLLFFGGGSKTGFSREIDKYVDGAWERTMISRIVYDWDNGGGISGYEVDGQYVSETEYDNVNQSIDEGLLTIDDLYSANEI